MPDDKFPVDIFAVKKYGIDKWQKNFFWPVSDDEFISIYKDIDQSFVNEISKQNRDIKIPLIIQDRFLILEYANFLHVLKVMKAIQSRRMDILSLNSTWWYRNLLLRGDIDTHISRINQYKEKIPLLSKKVKSIAKSIICNKHILLHPLSMKNKTIVKLVGSINPLVEKYLTSYSDWVYLTSQSDWLPKDAEFELPEDFKSRVCQCSKDLVARLNLIASKRDIPLSSAHKEHLQRLAEEEIMNAARISESIKQNLKCKKKIDLLISGRGNQFYITAGMAVQEHGGTVTMIAHGGDTGFLNHPALLVNHFDIPTVNNFVTYNSESARLYERIKTNHSKCKDNKLNILFAETDEYFKLWKRHRKKQISSRNKKVMIIGYPHSQWRKPFTGSFALVRLDMELRLIDFLKRHSYDVFYKAHPHRMSETKDIFESKAHVLKGYLQNHLDKVDVFLFPSITTTAFSVALCTNKPVITFDLSYKRHEAFPEAMELLKKRCMIIDTKFDERNRIFFNEKELLRALSQKPEKQNNQFIIRYMFPTKIRNRFTTHKAI